MEPRHPDGEQTDEGSPWTSLISYFQKLRRRQITFFVEDQPYERTYGATVEHAVIAHDQGVLKEIRANKAWIVDSRGARVGLEGTLENGIRLYIRYVEEHPSAPSIPEGS